MFFLIPCSSTLITEFVITFTSNMITSFCFLNNSFTGAALPEFQVILKEFYLIFFTRTIVLREETFGAVHIFAFITFGWSPFFSINNSIQTFLIRTQFRVRFLGQIKCPNFTVFCLKFYRKTFVKLSFRINNLRTELLRTDYFLKSRYFIYNVFLNT